MIYVLDLLPHPNKTGSFDSCTCYILAARSKIKPRKVTKNTRS